MDDNPLVGLSRHFDVYADVIVALKNIVANSEETNEWDAVDKLHENLETAKEALAKVEGK